MSDKDVPIELELKRGGPSTPEGKTIVSRNAIKHGILAHVIPDHEVEPYKVHVRGVYDHYQPVGYMEEALTERIATSLWRLGRVLKYENTTVDQDTRRSIDNLHKPDQSFASLLSDLGSPIGKPPKHPDELRSDIAELARGLDFHRLGSAELAGRDAATLQAWVMGAHAYALDVSDHYRDAYRRAISAIDKLHGIKPREADWLELILEEETLEWDYAQAVRAVELLMSFGEKIKLPEDWETVDGRLSWRLNVWQTQLENVEKEHLRIWAREGIPSPNVADKIAKYEAHIERTLYRAMHELEAMQERRLGKQTPLARVEIHGTG